MKKVIPKQKLFKFTDREAILIETALELQTTIMLYNTSGTSDEAFDDSDYLLSSELHQRFVKYNRRKR